MNIIQGSHQSRSSVDAGPGRLASVEVIEDMSEAEPYWRMLQTDEAASTPYQGFDFLKAWQCSVGSRRGVTPFIVVGFDSHNRPMCLLPLGFQRVGALRQLRFLGGKHANFNFGLWDRSVAGSITRDGIQSVLHRIAASPHRPDVLALQNQPRTWLGVDNPFLLLPHRAAVSSGACLIIDAPAQEVIERELSAATRGRLRSKQRKLQKLAGYRYFQATRPDEIARLLNRFFELKAAHLAAQGLPNVFAEEDVERFLRSTCHQGLNGRPSVELHGLESDEELLALVGVLTDGRNLSVMINTYTLSDTARHSPGLILILHLIQVCADRGIVSFDIGAGQAQYKSWFCKQPIALFDSFLPLTPLGRLFAIGVGTANALKREIKNSPALWNTYRTLRRAFAS